MIALRYGSHIFESASRMNLKKLSLFLRKPKSKGVSMLVLTHFSAISLVKAKTGSSYSVSGSSRL